MTSSKLPDFRRWGPVEEEALTGIRRLTAEHMMRAWREIPHVTQHDVADITSLEEERKQRLEQTKASGIKLTLTAVLIKLLEAALKLHPKLNASIDQANEKILLKKYCHIGVAVDTPRGLLAPVIRDVGKKSILQIAEELGGLSRKAREGKLKLEEMQGGSFTVTNLGGIRGGFFTPIINWPEVAILGVGRSVWAPVWMNGQAPPRLRLPLSLSYDHRLIDGADAARFMKSLIESLEAPTLSLGA